MSGVEEEEQLVDRVAQAAPQRQTATDMRRLAKRAVRCGAATTSMETSFLPSAKEKEGSISDICVEGEGMFKGYSKFEDEQIYLAATE